MLITIFVLIASVVILVLVWPESTRNDRWDEEAQLLTIERAQPIIKAIDAYRVDHADEPDSLDDLIPEYFGERPLPLVGGQAWEYHKTQRSYELSVPSSNPNPPSLLWMMIFGPSFDDRYFVHYQGRDAWGKLICRSVTDRCTLQALCVPLLTPTEIIRFAHSGRAETHRDRCHQSLVIKRLVADPHP